jgi:putative ABC transport system ATP-binding protein
MLQLDNVSITFEAGTPNENKALRGVNLQINDGDFISIIGSNGAGKSTLFNAISGTIIPTDGKVFFGDGADKRDVTKEPEFKRARYIGRIFQNPLLGTAGRLSLEDNMMICSRKGYPGLKISLNHKKRAEFQDHLKVLGMGLESRLKDNVELLSGGQRQALTLLMTVMTRPKLLLLDEHTAALDPHNAELVMNLTLRFAREYGLTVMMITHNMQSALTFGNRLLMMDSGEIILDVNEEEKKRLTLDDLIHKFKEIKKQELSNDEMLLS